MDSSYGMLTLVLGNGIGSERVSEGSPGVGIYWAHCSSSPISLPGFFQSMPLSSIPRHSREKEALFLCPVDIDSTDT